MVLRLPGTVTLPGGHAGVVVCGTRRAERWRAALREAGIEAVVVETEADEAAQRTRANPRARTPQGLFGGETVAQLSVTCGAACSCGTC